MNANTHLCFIGNVEHPKQSGTAALRMPVLSGMPFCGAKLLAILSKAFFQVRE
jgi:hypothetical protein